MMQPDTIKAAVAIPNSSAPQQSSNDNVPARLHLTVGLDDDAATEIVGHQHLMGFRQTQFPGNSGMLDTGQGRRAGTATITGNQDDIGMCLGNPGSHRPDTNFGYQLYADTCTRV